MYAIAPSGTVYFLVDVTAHRVTFSDCYGTYEIRHRDLREWTLL
jgi:hypothetical protein